MLDSMSVGPGQFLCYVSKVPLIIRERGLYSEGKWFVRERVQWFLFWLRVV